MRRLLPESSRRANLLRRGFQSKPVEPERAACRSRLQCQFRALPFSDFG
ncbi:hypothetical protein RHECNPAF_1260035 [Rhizobium etli CNPAF512]|nr:hypothetical protein RHECNPAF_1260035 [Rhizobium etli CNPAF512]